MSSHSKYSASSSSRWLTCTGSLKAIEYDRQSGKLPKSDETNIYAELGTAVHELAEISLGSKQRPKQFMGQTISQHVVTEEMVLGATVYYDYVLRKAKEYGVEAKIEQRGSLKTVLGVDCGGTMDCIFTSIAFSLLHVIDYKNGRGFVHAENNTQMMLYALQTYHALPKRIKPKIKDIEMTIVQPNAYEAGHSTIRSSTISVRKLLAWQIDVVEPAIAESESGAMILRATEKGCEWCPRKSYCEENAAHQMRLVELEFSDLSDISQLPEPNSISNDRILLILENKDRLTKWMNSVYMYAQAVQTNKPTFKGYKIVESISNLRWKENITVDKLKSLKIPKKKMLNLPDLKTPSQLTKVVQVEKNVNAQQAQELVDVFMTRVATGYRMVKDSSAGTAIIDTAEHEFAEHVENPKIRDQKNGNKVKEKNRNHGKSKVGIKAVKTKLKLKKRIK